jgi:hypothetical protein
MSAKRVRVDVTYTLTDEEGHVFKMDESAAREVLAHLTIRIKPTTPLAPSLRPAPVSSGGLIVEQL